MEQEHLLYWSPSDLEQDPELQEDNDRLIEEARKNGVFTFIHAMGPEGPVYHIWVIMAVPGGQLMSYFSCQQGMWTDATDTEDVSILLDEHPVPHHWSTFTRKPRKGQEGAPLPEGTVRWFPSLNDVFAEIIGYEMEEEPFYEEE